MFGLNYFQSQTLLQVFLGWEKNPVHVCRYNRPMMVVDPTVPAHCYEDCKSHEKKERYL